MTNWRGCGAVLVRRSQFVVLHATIQGVSTSSSLDMLVFSPFAHFSCLASTESFVYSSVQVCVLAVVWTCMYVCVY